MRFIRLGFVILLILISWPLLYIQHSQQMIFAKNAIMAYQALTRTNQVVTLATALPILAHLQEATVYDTEALPLLQQGVRRYLIPLIDNLYQHTLTQSMSNPTPIYPLLKAYFMLGNKMPLSLPFFIRTTQWLVPADEQAALGSLIPLMFNTVTGVTLNPTLIIASQTAFKNAPLEEQAYVILLTEYGEPVTIARPLQFSFFTFHTITIARLFTGNEFDHTQHQYIPATTQIVLHGNDIIGTENFPEVNPKDVNALLYNLYLTAYANAWGSFVSGIQLKPVDTLAAANRLLIDSSSTNGQWVQLLALIRENTQFPAIEKLSPALAALNAFSRIAADNAVSLQRALAPIADVFSSGVPAITPFMLTHLKAQDERLLKFREALPSPVKQWMVALSNQLWQIGLKHLIIEANAEWEKFSHFYNTHLYHQYPLSRDTKKEVDIKAFTQFLAPHGLLDQYFEKHLSVWVDRHLPLWRFVEIPGMKTPDKTVLLHLQEIASVQSLFFKQNKLAITFTLTPQQLSENTLRFLWNDNGQLLMMDAHTDATPIDFTWQGTDDTVSFALVDQHGNVDTHTEQGVWALFHAFDHAHLVPTNNPQIYTVSFSTKTTEASLLLFSDNNTSIFAKHSFELPALPEKLLPE